MNKKINKKKEVKEDYVLKAENGFHSNDLSHFPSRFQGKTMDLWEKELGLSAIFVKLTELGWEHWQWQVYTPKELKSYKHLTHFVEVFSPYYNGYLRGDSRLSLRDACEKALNQAQKFAMCESKTGHYFEPKKGYDNGLLSCKHCGFWGYSNLFEQNSRQIKHYKIHAEIIQRHEINTIRTISNIGLGINMFQGLLIKNIDKDGYTRCNDEFKLTDAFLKDLWSLFKKHKLVNSDKQTNDN